MKTVRIRVAVMVNEAGEWEATGWKTSRSSRSAKVRDRDAIDAFSGTVEGAHSFHFVEADVPLPESTTVIGKAIAAEEARHG